MKFYLFPIDSGIYDILAGSGHVHGSGRTGETASPIRQRGLTKKKVPISQR
jgi:hypothetical protein